jgi:hypothetical protein
VSLEALVVGTALPEYRVSATPNHDGWENKIHEDGPARAFGFRGALVPGVTVYSWMTHPVVAALGGAWLDHGTFSVRFAKPVYFGETVTVRASVAAHSKEDVTIQSRVVNDQDEVCATATMGLPLGPLLPLPDVAAYPAAALPAEPPLASRAYLEQRAVLGTPQIHVESHGQHLSVARVRERLETRARIKHLFQGKGHEFVELDLLLLAEGARAVASIRHVVIYQLRTSAPDVGPGIG